MHNPIMRTAITVLELLFFAGIIGSAVVILLTGIEDVRTMFSRKEEEK